MRVVVLFVFCYQNIVTVIVNVVHMPSLHHRPSLWCKLGVRTVNDRCRSGIFCVYLAGLTLLALSR